MARDRLENYTFLQGKLAMGSQVAFKAIYDGLAGQLYQFAFSIVHYREVAEEVVQDVFLQLWNHRLKIEAIESLRLWLLVATRNTAISHLRRNNRHKTFNLDDLKLPFLKVEISPEEQCINKELSHRINMAINNLPLQCRLVFKLVKQDGLKYREVAELLHLHLKTVENQVGIAMRKLHSAFPTTGQNKKKSAG